jgi:hypothetical protein
MRKNGVIVRYNINHVLSFYFHLFTLVELYVKTLVICL